MNKNLLLLFTICISIIFITGCNKKNENKKIVKENAVILEKYETDDFIFENTTLLKENNILKVSVNMKNNSKEDKNIKRVYLSLEKGNDYKNMINIYVDQIIKPNDTMFLKAESSVLSEDIKNAIYRIEYGD